MPWFSALALWPCGPVLAPVPLEMACLWACFCSRPGSRDFCFLPEITKVIPSSTASGAWLVAHFCNSMQAHVESVFYCIVCALLVEEWNIRLHSLACHDNKQWVNGWLDSAIPANHMDHMGPCPGSAGCLRQLPLQRQVGSSVIIGWGT